MPRPRLKLNQLRRILRSFGVVEDESRGKGSNTLFLKKMSDGVYSYPVPKSKDVRDYVINGCRRKFGLTPEDGVTDDEFYGRR